MAKHRAIPPMSFGTLLVLAVVGAIASALLVYALNPSPKRPAPEAAAAVPSPTVSPGVLEPSAPPTSASVAPPPSPSPRSSRSAAPAPARSRSTPPSTTFTARYYVTSAWDDGFVTGFEVTNTGSQPGTWVVEVTYAANVVISSQDVWNATVSRSGDVYRFRANPSAPLAAGQRAQFGYMAKAPRGASRPSRCTVNGRTCQ